MLREALKDVRQRRSGRDAVAPSSDEHAPASPAREAARSPPRAAGVAGQRATLPAAVADALLRRANQVAHDARRPGTIQLWHGFANAFSALLAVLAIVSGHRRCALGDRHRPDGRAQRFLALLPGAPASLAAEKLQIGARHLHVVRQDENGKRRDGDPHPRVVRATSSGWPPATWSPRRAAHDGQDLFVAQSALTGEALPLERPHRNEPFPRIARIATSLSSHNVTSAPPPPVINTAMRPIWAAIAKPGRAARAHQLREGIQA